ncbi:MAG: GGDEF domain-containing protein, partial [Nitrospiraceae bacterium]
LRGRGRPRKKPATPKPSDGARTDVSVTISIGAAEGDGRYVNPDEVVKAADQALYRAKRAGRNRVRI